MKRITGILSLLMALVIAGSSITMACWTPTYDVDAQIVLCGDPRAIITLVNDSNVPRTFDVRFTRIKKDGTTSRIFRTPTLSRYETRTLPRQWVAKNTRVTVRGEEGELLARVLVTRENISGPCREFELPIQ